MKRLLLIALLCGSFAITMYAYAKEKGETAHPIFTKKFTFE